MTCVMVINMMSGTMEGKATSEAAPLVFCGGGATLALLASPAEWGMQLLNAHNQVHKLAAMPKGGPPRLTDTATAKPNTPMRCLETPGARCTEHPLHTASELHTPLQAAQMGSHKSGQLEPEKRLTGCHTMAQQTLRSRGVYASNPTKPFKHMAEDTSHG